LDDWLLQHLYEDLTTDGLPIGSTTAAATYSLGVSDKAVGSGSSIGLLTYGSPQMTLVDLSGSSPSATNITLPNPVNSFSAFGAYTASQWLVGNAFGVVFDGNTVATTPRYFGYGAVTSIAGSPNNVAIATASGKILLYDPTGKTQLGSVNFLAGKIQMSSDGSTLAALASNERAHYEPDATLNIYSLPSFTVVNGRRLGNCT